MNRHARRRHRRRQGCWPNRDKNAAMEAVGTAQAKNFIDLLIGIATDRRLRAYP